VELRVRLSSLSDLYVKEGDVIYEGETIGKVNTQELERKRQEFALALERYALGLIEASEIQKLELGLWELEEACEVKASLSGQITDIRILSASPEGVEVALQILPNVEPRSLPPVNPRITASEKIDPRLKELPELPKDQGEVVYILRVLDGDTVELLYQGKAEKARLVGVDTPETKDPRKPVQCFGPEASQFTTTTLPRGLEARITWNPLGDRSATSTTGFWSTSGSSLTTTSLWSSSTPPLVRLGYARVYPFFKFDRLQEFRNFEAEAMAEKAGLWGACNYEPYQK
jgi:micrococcal nuclease